MATAIIRGGLRSGCLDAADVCVAEPDPTKRAVFQELGVETLPKAGDVLKHFGLHGAVVLAVKPQMLDAVATEVSGAVGPRLVITMLAGTTIERVRERLGGQCRVVRVMPNLPASIGQGASAVSKGASATEADLNVAIALFGAVGPCVERLDESLMDAFTAIAGSGPAYLFYLAEAMISAATRLGMEQAVAERVVRATLCGSGALLSASRSSPEELRSAVTSKGGTTFAATSVLEAGQAKDLLVRAMVAARDRGQELGRL